MPALHRAAAAATSGLARLYRVAGPWLQRALRWTGGRLRAMGRRSRRHRGLLRAAGLRATWWAALGLLVLGGRPVLGVGPVPDRWIALAPFVVGLLLCAALRLLAARRHLRAGALGLGALHGTAVVLVWTAFAG